MSIALLVAAAISINGSVATFSEPITQSSVEAFIQAAAGSATPVKTVMLNSSGGKIDWAIVLGQWIHRNKIDVEVNGLCISSCANYLFTAGHRKRIHAGSVVAWHGSALQHDYRAIVHEFESLTQAARLGSLSVQQQDRLNVISAKATDLIRLQRLQAEFYAEIGVDERITRLGQEPQPIAETWTVTVPTMGLYGIRNVTAPDNYGRPDYLREINFMLKTLRQQPYVPLNQRSIDSPASLAE
jgi:hypothetical protein